MSVNIYLSSILSGMLISMGGMLFIGSKWIHDSEFFNFIGSILFSSGLLTICYFKLHLFTGKVGLMFEREREGESQTEHDMEDIHTDECEQHSHEQHSHEQHTNNEFTGISGILKLTLILVLNLISAASLGIIARLILRKTYFVTIISSITSNKLSFTNINSYVKCFLQSVYCGSCVHFAVKTFPKHFLFCVFFISCFVYNGFQHCIANAFYFGSLFSFNINMIINEVIVIIGNIVGTIPIALIHI